MKDMTMENKALTLLKASDVSPVFLVCFNDQCARRADCVRHLCGQVVNSERDHGAAVFPSSLQADGRCRYFFQLRIIRVAWGFRSLFRTVRHEHYDTLRHQVKRLFGSDRHFYRYNRGEYKLTPERQAEVLAIFQRYGYDTTDFRFEHYEEQVDLIGR
ncbi:MAG: hypothetical protein IJ197_00010 [Bacteroidaceae bacterium]|nr:hypothetical protein [Bacteroidaceae bacterium]